MSETKPRIVRRSHEERRNLSKRKLIESALAIAADEGVTAATFDAIGARAGYSRGLASQKFGSKGAFMSAVIDYLHDNRAASQDYAELKQMRGLDALLSFVAVHLQALTVQKEAKAYFVFLAGSVADMTEMRALFAASHERSKHEIMELFARGQKDGSIRMGIDAEAAALMIGSLVIGVSVQFLVDPQMDLARVIAETVSVLRASFCVSGDMGS